MAFGMSSLLLCYPQPQSDMGLSAIRNSDPRVVFMVGEFEGDTGTTALTKALFSRYCLREVVLLPNWTDTAHSLTIWEKLPLEKSARENMQAAGLETASKERVLACRVSRPTCVSAGCPRRCFRLLTEAAPGICGV